MYADYKFCALQDREIRDQELAERMAEARRQALTHGGMRPILLEHYVEGSDSRRGFTERGVRS